MQAKRLLAVVVGSSDIKLHERCANNKFESDKVKLGST